MTCAFYAGAGNTFFLADNREKAFDHLNIQELCTQKNRDGAILIEKSNNADVRMRYFNRDGKEAEMCGNGLRCLIHFLFSTLGIKKDIYTIETQAGMHRGWFVQDEVCIEIFRPHNLKLHLTDGLHFINTGVPHAVLFVDDLDMLDVEKLGSQWRHSSLFQPEGANVNFVKIQPDLSLALRTYERGVEKETLACGTGAIASALIAHKMYQLPSQIDIWTRSKERLKVSFTKDWSQVLLQGPVKIDERKA